MKEGVFVSEALDYSSIKKGQINLIYSSCGSGKTTAIYKTIPQAIGIKTSKVLVLIDTTAGKDSFIKEGQAEEYLNGEFTSIKPTIMTYASFGAKIKDFEMILNDYDMIVCDEIHAMRTPVCIARGKLAKQFPQAKPWEINDMLKMTCFNYIAIETISDIAEKGEKWVFGLTATPRNIEKIKQFNGLIEEVKFSQALRAYEIISSFEYADIEEILQKAIPDDRKRAFFFSTVKELKKYRQLLLENGRKAEAIWSVNHGEQMNEHQLLTRDYVLEEHKLPNDVQDLLFNKAYETAITLKDDTVKEIYIHSGDVDTRIQARNRFRQDIEVVGYYNVNKAKNKKKAENRKNVGFKEKWEIPTKYLNVPLDKKQRDALILDISFPKKWTTLKKVLLDNNYQIQNKTIRGIPYVIIQKNQ